MSKMYNHLKRMMTVAEQVGDITGIDLGEWLDRSERINIRGKTADGLCFDMVLEVEKEVKQDGN